MTINTKAKAACSLAEEQAGGDGLGDEIRARAAADLFLQAVRFDGLDADVQPLAHLGARETERGQLEDFALA